MPGAPNSFSVSDTRVYLEFTIGNREMIDKNYLVFWYTNDRNMFASDLPVSKIMSKLTHSSGNDKLSNYGNYYYTSFVMRVSSVEKRSKLEDKIHSNFKTQSSLIMFCFMPNIWFNW